MRRFNFNSFVNSGFGWFCKACSVEGERREVSGPVPSRLFLEGEADKTASISKRGRAVWRDREEGVLFCPECGVTETRVAETENQETT